MMNLVACKMNDAGERLYLFAEDRLDGALTLLDQFHGPPKDADCQLLVIDTELSQDRRVQVAVIVRVLFGLVAMMGVRIWLDGRVDFRDPVNLMTAAVAVIVGAGNYTLTSGDFSFGGVTLGSVAAIVMYHVLRGLQRRSGASVEGVDNATPTTGETVVPALSVERRV